MSKCKTGFNAASRPSLEVTTFGTLPHDVVMNLTGGNEEENILREFAELLEKYKDKEKAIRNRLRSFLDERRKLIVKYEKLVSGLKFHYKFKYIFYPTKTAISGFELWHLIRKLKTPLWLGAAQTVAGGIASYICYKEKHDIEDLFELMKKDKELEERLLPDLKEYIRQSEEFQEHYKKMQKSNIKKFIQELGIDIDAIGTFLNEKLRIPTFVIPAVLALGSSNPAKGITIVAILGSDIGCFLSLFDKDKKQFITLLEEEYGFYKEETSKFEVLEAKLQEIMVETKDERARSIANSNKALEIFFQKINSSQKQ